MSAGSFSSFHVSLCLVYACLCEHMPAHMCKCVKCMQKLEADLGTLFSLLPYSFVAGSFYQPQSLLIQQLLLVACPGDPSLGLLRVGLQVGHHSPEP